MTDTDKCLASVKARAAAATPGPWRLVNEIDPNPIFLNTWGPNYKTVFYIQAGYGFGEGGNSETFSSLINITPPHITHLSMADAAFIAHARTDIPRLVAMVEAALALHGPCNCDRHHQYTCGLCELRSELDRLAAGGGE